MGEVEFEFTDSATMLPRPLEESALVMLDPDKPFNIFQVDPTNSLVTEKYTVSPLLYLASRADCIVDMLEHQRTLPQDKQESKVEKRKVTTNHDVCWISSKGPCIYLNQSVHVCFPLFAGQTNGFFS